MMEIGKYQMERALGLKMSRLKEWGKKLLTGDQIF